MKRGRTETERGELRHIQMDYSGPSFSDLPGDIMVNVLLRLSVKRIFVCKIVCKTWHGLISKPEFAKLHFDQAEAYPLMQVSGYTAQFRMLYLVQPEEQKDFEHKLEMYDHREYSPDCECRVKFELDTKFKLPFRNLQIIFDDKDSVRNNCMRIKMKYQKYHVVNSCNGMLCLSRPHDNDPLVVCNPITCEFSNLPDPEVHMVDLSRNLFLLCGFGFSPTTNQYKVIRMFPIPSSTFNGRSIGAKVHTIGTETWKDIEVDSEALQGLLLSATEFRSLCPAYLNGFLYWYCKPYGGLIRFCLVSFDIEKECFGSISLPPLEGSIRYDEVRLGVLGGELSVSWFTGAIQVWVMKDFGTTNVWSKVLSTRIDCVNGWFLDTWIPVKCLNDGALLMFNSCANCFMYKHPRKHGVRYFRFHGVQEVLEAIAHIPSFVSLKDALGRNVKVLKPRCTELKVQDEDRSVSLRETNEVTFVEGILQDTCEIIL